MPLSFNLPQRPSLPTLSWGTSSPKVDEDDSSECPTPTSAPARTSQSSSSTTSAFSKRLSARSLRHTSLVVSRPSTPATAKASPLSASFGLPTDEEDDPFGVLALQKAGLLIKEAGTNQNHRPGSEAFQYRPSPNSPVWRSSMASAMSKNSRPSMEGRASIMTGRPSFAHSRHSSISEIGGPAGTDTDGNGNGLDRASSRGMSPVRETGQSKKTSPEHARKVSPAPRRTKVGGTGERPPPLKLQGANGERWRSDEPSPKTRMSAVSEKIKEIERQQKAREAKANEEKKKNDKNEESDLDRLAREIREMAHEHEEEQRRSEEEESRKSEDNLASPTSEHVSKPSISPSSTGGETTHVLEKRTLQLSRAGSKRESKRASKLVSGAEQTARKDDAQSVAKATQVVIDDTQDNGEDDEDDDGDDGEDDYDSFDDEEEPVIIEQAVQTPITLRPRNLGVQRLQARAQVVSIHMPPPPAIPSRNPRRARNSQITEDGGSTQTSPGIFQDDSTVSVQAVASPDSVFTNSKAASVYSARDNDSTSSYSLEPERESLNDMTHDLMSQTSHGSNENEPTESTPTKTKMGGPELPVLTERLETEVLRKSTDGELQDSVAATTEASTTTEKHVDTTPERLEIEGKQAEDGSEIEVPKEHFASPEVPERRRPFSYEAQESDGTEVTATTDTALNQHENAPTTSKTHEKNSNTTTDAAVQPIIIPDLPEDDKSEYEEDFS